MVLRGAHVPAEISAQEMFSAVSARGESDDPCAVHASETNQMGRRRLDQLGGDLLYPGGWALSIAVLSMLSVVRHSATGRCTMKMRLRDKKNEG